MNPRRAGGLALHFARVTDADVTGIEVLVLHYAETLNELLCRSPATTSETGSWPTGHASHRPEPAAAGYPHH